MQTVGIDCGTSALKLVVMAEEGIQYRKYVKHHGDYVQALLEMLKELEREHPKAMQASLMLTGSHAAELAGNQKNIRILQDIPALTAGVEYVCPEAVSVIEIGSQNARYMTGLGSDMPPQFATNEHCAGGTGSFFENQMARLGKPIEEYSDMTRHAQSIPRLSGRCAVFAKTDIIHRQQEGQPIEDILLGLCYAVIRNFKAVIVKKLPVHRPVVLCGGVAWNEGVVRAVREVFGLSEQELIIPEEFPYMGAIGAALEAGEGMLSVAEFMEELGQRKSDAASVTRLHIEPVLEEVHMKDPICDGIVDDKVVLGIDIGSTSTNLVLIDGQGRLIDFQYLRTLGDAAKAVQTGLDHIHSLFPGIQIRAIGVTGSGRERIGQSIGADVIRDEITAQARAAVWYDREVDTVFEIGGQDSKFIVIRDGEVVDFRMNKICSAGTGTLAEEQAFHLGLPIETFGEMALESEAPVNLGERCTVFIESAVAAAAARCVSLPDITAGICEAIVSNYLHKVTESSMIGQHIVLQGGVAYNPGIVAAFKRRFPTHVSVNPYFPISGALGVALIAASEQKTADIQETQENEYFMERSMQALLDGYDGRIDPSKKTVGVPYVLVIHKLFPMIHGFFKALGFNVLLSTPTNEHTVALSQQYAQGEVCFPVKLIFGHMRELVEKKVDYIFMPAIHTMKHKHSGVEHNYGCVYMQTAGRIVAESLEIEKYGIKLLNPVFDLDFGAPAMAASMVGMGQTLGFSKPACVAALMKGSAALVKYTSYMEAQGKKLLASLQPGDKVLVLISRPYNIGDPTLNMKIGKLLIDKGYKVITVEHLPAEDTDISDQYPNFYWPFSQHIVTGAKQIRRHPNLYAVYLTNHGCGPDTMLTHVFRKEMEGKPYLQIEVDEHYSPVGIITRIEAFLNSLTHQPSHIVPEDFDVRAIPVEHFEIRRTPSGERKLYIPYMPVYAELLADYYRRSYQVQAIVLPPVGEEQLQMGRNVTSTKEYITFTSLLGSILWQAAQDEEPFDVLVPENQGADADGVFARVIASILEEKGLSDSIGIITPMLEKMPTQEADISLLFRGLLTGDILYHIPGEKREKYIPAQIPDEEQLLELAEKAAQIGDDRKRIAVTGEPYSMYTLGERLLTAVESGGFTLSFAPLAEYMWFLWKDNADNKGSKLLDELSMYMKKVSDALQGRSAFCQEMKELFTVADDKFPGYAGANGRYRYAKVRLQQHVSAVITVAPRYENTAFVQELAGIDTDLPLYHLAVDADEDDNLMNALESFLFYLH